MHVLVVDPATGLEQRIKACCGGLGWDVAVAPDLASARRRATQQQVDAVVLAQGGTENPDMRAFLRLLDKRRIAAVVIGRDVPTADEGGPVLIDFARDTVTAEEIAARLTTLDRFQGYLRRVERELDHMQRLGQRLHQHFREIDDEMRLASRLQQDFLPRELPSVDALQFATLYRPASWVSGDIYDIQRIDERHVGFYVADAVGHGMSAGLLTMFIKRALVTRRAKGDGYEIVDPADALRQLNDAMVQHTLHNCRFVTVVYCLLNLETLTMRYARAGHPYPIVVSADGRTRECRAPGGLMGLFPGMECTTEEIQLVPGDRVVLYTDGIETAYDYFADALGCSSGAPAMFQVLCADGVDAMASRLRELLDTQSGSLLPEDDVTVVGVQVQQPPEQP